MIIREATDSDVIAIANLHAESWRSAYRGILSDDYLDSHVHRDRLTSWQEKFAATAGKPMFVLLADLGTELAGFACVFPEDDAVFGSFLDNLHVAPNLTGQGIGRQLLCEIACRLTANGSHSGLYLWVVEQNHRARRFYEKAGASGLRTNPRDLSGNKSIQLFQNLWHEWAQIRKAIAPRNENHHGNSQSPYVLFVRQFLIRSKKDVKLVLCQAEQLTVPFACPPIWGTV